MPYKKIAIISVIVLVVSGGGFSLYKNSQNKASDPTSSDKAGKDPANFNEANRNGGVVDSNESEQSDKNNGIKSKSGNITVFTPNPGSLISTGSSVSGLSNSSEISYRLIDDNKGVIARGSLEVVAGEFSGKFHFSSKGTEGRFDVFHVLDDLREVDIVNIPVRFK
jgi:hypothetical protein